MAYREPSGGAPTDDAAEAARNAAATKGKSLGEIILELEAEKASLEAEIDTSRKRRAELARELREVWLQMEDPGSKAVPLTATEAMALESCESRTSISIMQETLVRLASVPALAERCVSKYMLFTELRALGLICKKHLLKC